MVTEGTIYPMLARLAGRCRLRVHLSIETDRERLPGLPPHGSPVAARMEAAAPAGGVLVTAETHRFIAARLRTGNVHLNGAGPDFAAPFGGYKQSGNGREYADWAIHDFLEIKGIIGYGE